MNAPALASAKDAALRIILGEMGPLLDRADAIGKTMAASHDLIAKDLGAMGELMTRVEVVLQEAAENATVLLQEQKALRAKSAAIKPVVATLPGAVRLPWLPMLGCAVLASMLAIAGMLAIQYKTAEQVRVGRAVIQALPMLDPATKAKLETAIQKSNGG